MLFRMEQKQEQQNFGYSLVIDFADIVQSFILFDVFRDCCLALFVEKSR